MRKGQLLLAHIQTSSVLCLIEPHRDPIAHSYLPFVDSDSLHSGRSLIRTGTVIMVQGDPIRTVREFLKGMEQEVVYPLVGPCLDPR